MKYLSVADFISGWLKEYVGASSSKGYVIGVSGGIDSALTSTLCARTGLPVLCVEMPIHQDPAQISRAQNHIAWLQQRYPNVSSARTDLSGTFDVMNGALPRAEAEHTQMLALANLRARLRMTCLYYYAGIHSLLVAGTGNKVEDFGIGFYTKYGDGGVDLSPIADLTKSEVYAIAAELGVIREILEARPTDGLWGDNRSDEDQIGATYPELEWAMQFDASGSTETEISERQMTVLAIFRRMHKANRHKMLPIPVCLIPQNLR
jgi:NAD+ synthase